MPVLLERFEKKFIPEPISGCWLWIGGISNTGYGMIGINGKRTKAAHRISWEIYRGHIPPDLWVLHKCDVRCCVNPDHLYLGTAKNNVHDLMKRGNPRFEIRKNITPEIELKRIGNLPRGAMHHRSGARLSEDQVRAIFLTSGPQRAIAARFGVCQQTVSLIKSKKRWAHLNAD